MPCRVLVVDDDPAFRGLAVRMIVACQLVVVSEAGTVAAAIAAAVALKPGAALVDVGLPDGDGITLARELSAMPWQPRVVLTSSDPEAASPEDVRDCGAHAFVAKNELPDAPLEQLLATGL
jgi:DNA-binding NarL/FixJ family response regulator